MLLCNKPSTALGKSKLALVLVCDDYPNVRHLLRKCLTLRGLEVVCAGDGQEALALAKANHPDLIISEIGLPGMSGLDLVQQIRADSELAAIPCILTSSVSWTEAATKAGANGFLAKPFDLRTVDELVRRLLENNAHR